MAVFHLKYRPKTFHDLDLPEVAKKLKNVLKGEDIPRSYLFSGPKGSGKTSAARITARAINCLKLKDGEPCNECDNCKDILSGNSIDVIEMDAASNRGIEDIREIKDRIYLSPNRLKKKIFIIDEVHMLTKEAFNALLKIIEEPPKHVIFILCTTDPEKIPETVLSRLIRIDFRKGLEEDMISSLKKVVEGEKMKVTTESLRLVASKSDGSFRNLHRMFNELALEYGKEITAEQINEFFNKNLGEYKPEDLEYDLRQGETKTILGKLEKMAQSGVDMSGFRERLISYFQTELLGCYGLNKSKVILSEAELVKFLNLLINSGKIEKEVSIPQLPLQMAVVEFGTSKSPVNIGGNNDNPAASTGSTEKKTTEQGNTDLGGENKTESANPDGDEAENLMAIIKNDIGIDIEDIEKQWGQILTAVKPYNHSVEAFLRAARPKSLKGNLLTLEVFYPFHKERLEEAKNRRIVEKGLIKVLNAEITFCCELGKSRKKVLVIKNDTPIEQVSEQLQHETEKKDMYDVAKEIFG